MLHAYTLQLKGTVAPEENLHMGSSSSSEQRSISVEDTRVESSSSNKSQSVTLENLQAELSSPSEHELQSVTLEMGSSSSQSTEVEFQSVSAEEVQVESSSSDDLQSITLEDLHKSIVLPNQSWCDQSPSPLTSIKLCKISSGASSSLIVTHCLSVSNTMQWSLFVHNCKVKQSMCPALTSILKKLRAHSLSSLLCLIDQLKVCVAQPDSHFITMASTKKGILMIIPNVDHAKPTEQH